MGDGMGLLLLDVSLEGLVIGEEGTQEEDTEILGLYRREDGEYR